MIKYVVGGVTIVILVIAGFFAWENRQVAAPTINNEEDFYTFGTINARAQIPRGWIYTTSEDRNFAAFRSPDFQREDGTSEPFGSVEGNSVVSGASILIPLFLFEESNPAPIGEMVTLGGAEGDIVTGSDESSNPILRYYRVRLHEDGIQYVLIALEYPDGYEGAEEIIDNFVSTFEFLGS